LRKLESILLCIDAPTPQGKLESGRMMEEEKESGQGMERNEKKTVPFRFL